MNTCLQCGEKLPLFRRSMLMCPACAKAGDAQTKNFTDGAASGAPLIYLSYRWSDNSALTDAIYDRLADVFGRDVVVRDLDKLPLGLPYARLLEHTFRRSVAVLFVVGPDWVTAQDALGRQRLDDPTDLVRMEIVTALRLSAPVIIVNISGKPFPPADLPDWIAPLKSRRCIEVGPDLESDDGLALLVAKLSALLGSPAPSSVALSRADELEHSLLRLDHAWKAQRDQLTGSSGKPLSGLYLMTIWLFGLIAVGSGVLGMLTALLPDLFCIVLIACGAVWPIYRAYEYRTFRRAQRSYRDSRSAIQAGLAAIDTQDKAFAQSPS